MVKYVIRHGVPDDSRDYWWNGFYWGSLEDAALYPWPEIAKRVANSSVPDDCYVHEVQLTGTVTMEVVA